MHTQLRTWGTSPWCQGAHRVKQDTSGPVTLPEGRCGSSPVQLWHWESADVCLCVLESNPNNLIIKDSSTLKLMGLGGNTVHCVYLKDKGKSNRKHFLYWFSLPKCLSCYPREFSILYLELLMISKDFLLDHEGEGWTQCSCTMEFRNGAIKTFQTAQNAPGNISSLEYTENLSLRGWRSFSAFKHVHLLPEVAPCACHKAQFDKLHLKKPLVTTTSHLVFVLHRVTGWSRALSDSLGFCDSSRAGRKADLSGGSTRRRSRQGFSHQGNCLLCFCNVHWKLVYIPHKFLPKKIQGRHQPLLILMEKKKPLKSCEYQRIIQVKRAAIQLANPLIINTVFVPSLFWGNA